MKKVTTFTANIYVGLQEKYDGKYRSVDEVRNLCQNYVNEIGWCVTVTPTEFIYKNGMEPGVIIGAINYPRFPSTPEQMKKQVLDLAEILLVELNQYRVSIVFTDETLMLECEDFI